MDHLQTEARNPASADLDELTPLQLVRLMSDEDAKVIPAVASQAEAIARAVEVVAERMKAGGRLVYVGAGTSGRLAVQDGAELIPTFSWPQERLLLLMAGGRNALLRSVEGAEDAVAQAVRQVYQHEIGSGPGVGIAQGPERKVLHRPGADPAQAKQRRHYPIHDDSVIGKRNRLIGNCLCDCLQCGHPARRHPDLAEVSVRDCSGQWKGEHGFSPTANLNG